MEYFGAATAAYNAKLVKREQVNRILDRIKRVSRDGGSKLGGTGSLSDFTEHMLTELGYHVINGTCSVSIGTSFHDISRYTVSWEHEMDNFTADDMREVSHQAKETKYEKQIKLIKSRIADAAEAGLKETGFGSHEVEGHMFPSNVVEYFTRNGFSFEEFDNFSGQHKWLRYSLIIRW
jgi:hypothetical protein